MGNTIGHQQPEWVPNIAPDRRDNNINNPVSSQLRDAFVSYTTPTMAMVAFAHVAYSFYRDKKRLQAEYNAKVSEIEKELEELRAHTDVERAHTDVERAQRTASYRTVQRIAEIEREEDEKYKVLVQNIDWYDEGLKRILDIRCSLFKSHKLREPLENEILAHVATDRSMPDLNLYHGVKDSIDNDHRYCGRDINENGKFRQVYMQMYREKLALLKEKNILKRIEAELKSHGR